MYLLIWPGQLEAEIGIALMGTEVEAQVNNCEDKASYEQILKNPSSG